MRNKLILDTLRTIQKSLGKYTLLLLIVLMGVSFFSGMLSISSAMGQSVDRYADEYALFDYQIFSNYGFDEEDMNTLKDIDDSFIVEGGYFYDVEGRFGDHDYVFRLESFDEEHSLNRVELIEGRYPIAPDEVLVEAANDLFEVPKIGEVVTLERGGSELDEILEHTEYTVVGVVNTPNYMSLEKGTSTLNNLTLNSFLYVPETAFTTDVYTTVYIGSKEARELDSFSEVYTEQVEQERKLIEEIADTAQSVRAEKLKEEIPEEYWEEIEEGQWTILTRDMHYPMTTYKDTVSQMQVIGLIFPIFFFLVAALVCLTTMKRMVDEQRGQIGILRALGYSRLQCASKFLIYALSATLIGGLAGVIFGIMIFPPIVYGTWNIMYNLPPLNYDTPWFNMVVAVVVFLVLMGLTTYSAIRVETAQVTSVLLRPKAPPAGKKVFLEKIPFIWKRLSFTAKITARNLIRYKQRFFMSVFGIAGCTCLLVSGFGMQGSIGGIAEIQYEELTRYEAVVSTIESTEISEELISEITAIDDALQMQTIATYAAEISCEEEAVVAYTQVYDDDAALKTMNVVRETSGREELTLTNDSILISAKLSELLSVDVGDEVEIRNADDERQVAKIGGIYEKYINHEIMISSEYYRSLFGDTIEKNSIFIEGNLDSEVVRDEIMELDGVNGITFNESIVSSFANISTSMNIVVAVIIISAASLAFVVLGNLTSINISERKREIATLKVLGFRHRETKEYIFKENMVLTVFGALLGVVLGIGAHNFIITQVEMDFIMFVRSISLSSIIYSVLLTILFSVVINRVMLSKLKKIDMIESLKSVE